MKAFIKESLYVLDYAEPANIVDTIFVSDDHFTAGYAYDINIEEANTGYSNLTFTMPTKIMPEPKDVTSTTGDIRPIDNPKLKLLAPLVKLRYNRTIYYTGDKPITVQEPSGYGDKTVYVSKTYSPEYPNNIIEDYTMDYIVQPTEKKRNGHEIAINFTAIDYPRFNLSKKKMGATINEDTVTRGNWSLYKSEPMSVPGKVQYIQWNQILSDKYSGKVTIPTEWDASTATSYPMYDAQISDMMKQSQEWPYGVAATVYWWPITGTGRFEGIMYNEGDYLTLNIYPKFKTGSVDVSEIEYPLDFYGYEWGFLDKGDAYLTPNNPCNYLNWILETTNWTIALSKDRTFRGSYNSISNAPTDGQNGDYLLIQTAIENSNYKGEFNEPTALPKLGDGNVGDWAVVRGDDGIAQYRWDGKEWYKDYSGVSKIETKVYKWKDGAWTECTNEVWTGSIDKETGVLYDVDQVETEVAKPEHSTGDLFETVALICNLNASESNCYNIITECAKQFQLYPVFDCINHTVALKLFAGKNYGLTYRLGLSLENTGIKKDGDKVITKLHCFGGQDNQGNENINIGEAERTYRKKYMGTYDTLNDLQAATVDGLWAQIKNDGYYFYYNNQWNKGTYDAEKDTWSGNGYEVDAQSGAPYPWDPNDEMYIQSRSPYGTEYIYNFKWMYDNGWMSKQQILDIYAENDKIQALNKSFLEPYTKDYTHTWDAYVDAGVTYSTVQDEYLGALNSMMNSYYRFPGSTTERFHAFPEKPADCRYGDPTKGENPNGAYIDIYHCSNVECNYTSSTDFTTCPKCGGKGKDTRTIHINTWTEEKASAAGTTSEQWKPNYKGFYQNVYDTFDGPTHKINVSKKFATEIIDDLTYVSATKSNETSFKLELKDGSGYDVMYDKSGGLYNWNDYVAKWLENLGYSINKLKEVEYYKQKIEELEQEYKNYQYILEKYEDGIQDKWGNFIIEGKYSDPQIVYPAVLMVKSLEASDKYCVPETTYSLSVIDSSGLVEYRYPYAETYNELVRTLHNAGQIVPKAGDYVSIYDEPMGLYAAAGLITNIKRVIDDPQSNTITIDTSYTDTEEFVGNIITATNTVLNNTDIYARTAILNANGTIDGAAISKSLQANSNENLAFIGVKGSSLLDSSGLLVTNPADPNLKMKYTGGGVYGTVNNGASYELMMGPKGINANYINAGNIDTQTVQIISGQRAKIKLDNLGLSVLDDNLTSSSYFIPTKTDTDSDGFRDWSNSNLKAFIGVDQENEGLLYLNGQMNITGGSKIAGWKITQDKLYRDNGGYVHLSTTDDNVFAAGPDKDHLITTIDKKGKLTTSSVDITGGSLKIGDNFSVSQSGDLTAKNATITGGSLKIGGNFEVTKEGALTASNATITGGSLKIGDNFEVTQNGDLTARNAKITGAISGASSINIRMGGYFFDMGVSTSHPNASGLNVEWGGINFRHSKGINLSDDGTTWTFSGGHLSSAANAYLNNYVTNNSTGEFKITECGSVRKVGYADLGRTAGNGDALVLSSYTNYDVALWAGIKGQYILCGKDQGNVLRASDTYIRTNDMHVHDGETYKNAIKDKYVYIATDAHGRTLVPMRIVRGMLVAI